ncbi:MAG: response regulator [Limisphaerales bacterium]
MSEENNPAVPDVNVLIVEDDEVAATYLRETLARIGCTHVRSVDAGEDALELAREFVPDLAVMDIRLRRTLDGITTGSRLHSQYGTQILFLSASDDAETLEKANAAIPFGFLVKPVDERTLSAMLEVGLARGRKLIQERDRRQGDEKEWICVCAWCKKIRDDQDRWKPLEVYLSDHSINRFTHGICPQCTEKTLESTL